MEMFYLVFAIYSYSSVTIPEPYTKDACEQAGKSLSAVWYRCVPAPQAEYCKFHYVTESVVPNGGYGNTRKVCD